MWFPDAGEEVNGSAGAPQIDGAVTDRVAPGGVERIART